MYSSSNESLLAKLYYHFLKKIVGPFTLQNTQVQPDFPELVLTCKIGSNELKVYLQKLEYRLQFKRWYMKDRVYNLYRLFSHGQNCKEIAGIIERDVYIPDIGLNIFNEKYKKRLIVASYINILSDNIDKVVYSKKK